MTAEQQFAEECRREVVEQGADESFLRLSREWLIRSGELKYSYHFSALGRPVIQYPQDMVAVQEIIWTVKPDVVVETGIAHGGSLILSASMLALLDLCEATERGEMVDPRRPRRKVVGIDIDIRPHNRAAIEAHPLSNRIQMIEGSSIDPAIIAQVKSRIGSGQRVMVFLDSNHTHDHVLEELEAYAPLTSKGSYCVVFDTVVEDMPDEMFRERPWSRGDNPKTAVWEYLRRLKTEGRHDSNGESFSLEIDKALEGKLMLTVAPDGYLYRPA